MKKYLVVGGFVTSKNDGDTHYVDAPSLCRLYGVNPKECWMKDERSFINEQHIEAFKSDDLIVLKPRYDGNYTLQGDN